ncbi:MAG: hypothetical protein JW797_19620 [Bradymonadales bacterium]|nr:hypothetical protein [Bradymonadales bacterium]
MELVIEVSCPSRSERSAGVTFRDAMPAHVDFARAFVCQRLAHRQQGVRSGWSTLDPSGYGRSMGPARVIGWNTSADVGSGAPEARCRDADERDDKVGDWPFDSVEAVVDR